MSLPLLIVRAYRLIPARIRRLWSFGSSTSHLALAALLAGGGWAVLLSYCRLSWNPGPFMPFPSWTDPGPQGALSWSHPRHARGGPRHAGPRTGLAWKLGEGGRGAP